MRSARVPSVSVSDALRLIPPGARLIASPGCGTPDTLLGALGAACGGRDWTLYTGLLLGAYPFLDAVEGGQLQYVTSHVMGPARDAVARGTASFVPVRYSQIGSMMRTWAATGPLVALVRLTAPNAQGLASLGVSTSYSRLAVDIADVVIAELDPTMPFTLGDSTVSIDRIDAWVDSEVALPSYIEATSDAVNDRIAEYVLDLIPPFPVLQVGIGSVPASIARRLGDINRGTLKFVGMVGDEIVALDEAGHLAPRHSSDPVVLGVELMGTERLWRWADGNRLLGMYGSERGHDPVRLAALDRFTSINSAIEIDLTGQINAEMVGSLQIGGPGGSLDYVQAAMSSDGGRSIVALPSTTSRSESRIVARLDAMATVSIPRTMADTVVTEYGVANLRGATLTERAESLLAIAHPNHRDRLSNELDQLRSLTS